jgi:formylglycine-generating enzyme required for sulfatase activity
MATLRELLRILRDLGIVVVVVLVIWKVATDDNDNNQDGSEFGAVPANKVTLMTNSIGMTLARIPAGEFLMGSSSYSRETAVRSVTLGADFWIGQHEVTQDAYRHVMGTSPAGFQGSARPVERGVSMGSSHDIGHQVTSWGTFRHGAEASSGCCGWVVSRGESGTPPGIHLSHRH